MTVAPRPKRSIVDEERCSLRDIDIFKDIPDSDLPALEQRVKALRLPRGASYEPVGGLEPGLVLIQSGALRLYRLTPDGHKLEVALFRAGTFTVGGRLAHLNVEAAEDTVICLVRQQDLESLVAHHPNVALRILPTLVSRLIESDERQEILAYWPVRARVATVLLRLQKEGVIEGVSQQEIADMVGASRETVTVVLAEFKGHGLVELGHRRVRILERERLRAAATN
jgi:CRP/FNR family transcriptional regulator